MSAPWSIPYCVFAYCLSASESAFCCDSVGFFRDSYHGLTMALRNSMVAFSLDVGV